MKADMTLFEDYKIRRVYDEESEIWWFSVIDIVQVLTQQTDYQTARKYWNKLKQCLDKEGSQLVTDCHRLKMKAAVGKQRFSDVTKTSGKIAQNVRKELDTKAGKQVITSGNYLPPTKKQLKKDKGKGS